MAVLVTTCGPFAFNKLDCIGLTSILILTSVGVVKMPRQTGTQPLNRSLCSPLIQ